MSDVTIMLNEYGVPFTENVDGSITVKGIKIECKYGLYYVAGIGTFCNPDVVVDLFTKGEH